MLAAAAVAPRQRLCVAFSGGADSTTLLHLLAGLRPRFGFDLCAAHVHHGLSPNADAWLDFCARQCAALGVAFHPFREQVARDHPAGLEAAARDVRHAALARVACDWLVFGHHQDDQAETLLFRLLRGAGVRGAAAMAAIEPGAPGRLRPLLGVRRADIRAFAHAASLEWIEDESNADPRHARNFLRHRVFPLLGEAFPGAVPALARASGHCREADGLLDDLAALDCSACGGSPLLRDRLLRLSDERVRNLLRWRVREMGCAAPARARLVEVVRQLRATQAPLYLPLGPAVCCAYRGGVWLEPLRDGAPEQPVLWRQESALCWGGGVVRFEPVTGAGIGRAALQRAADVALVPRWPGLTMRQNGGRPRRSFKNLCQEAGLPAWLRPRLPVLCIDGEAAWIGEIGVAAEFRCAAGEAGLLPVWQR
ncbi:tRNA lysidine(34) synthetase TilS [Azoarcus sp. PA01]|nr:tRNA lysidine(34) synthetase TilS [Azoarcus sp. PA01]